jgi:phage shock protein PspC (stress-responsive transcriptional regulator)
MWAGVAGGIAEYFELDPSLVRLLWVAATVVSGGLAVPVYILAWIILPRDDRSMTGGPNAWRDWSDEFHQETQRLAEEARRVADDVRGTGHTSYGGAGTGPASGASRPTAEPAGSTGSPAPSSGETAWWQSERYVEPRRSHHHHSRSTGVVLVGLGILLLAANAGFFAWIDWHTMWPLIFIGLGVVLLARQWSR